MHEWLEALRKSAKTASSGVPAEDIRRAETQCGCPFPAELADLYLAINGGEFQGDVRLYELHGPEGAPCVLEKSRLMLVGLPAAGVWRFGLKGHHRHLFTARKSAMVEQGDGGGPLPGWVNTLDNDDWVYGTWDTEKKEMRLYRRLKDMLEVLVPPAEVESFGERTFARAMNAVLQGALSAAEGGEEAGPRGVYDEDVGAEGEEETLEAEEEEEAEAEALEEEEELEEEEALEEEEEEALEEESDLEAEVTELEAELPEEEEEEPVPAAAPSPAARKRAAPSPAARKEPTPEPTAAKPPAAKKATGKGAAKKAASKPAAKKAANRPAAKKAAAKKAASKPAAKKAAAKKVASKPAAKKAAAKKATGKGAAKKGAAARKTAGGSAAKKAGARKGAAAKKAPAKKAARGGRR